VRFWTRTRRDWTLKTPSTLHHDGNEYESALCCPLRIKPAFIIYYLRGLTISLLLNFIIKQVKIIKHVDLVIIIIN